MSPPQSAFRFLGAILKGLGQFQVGGLLLLLLPGGFELRIAAAQPSNSLQDQIADVQVEMDNAIAQVQKIVNQPVAGFAIPPGKHVPEFKEGWFHPGAYKPDFANVDVRKNQEKIYDQYDFVTSSLNPGIMFRGRDLEFNHDTKYFYLDYSLPKKKLTEAEMLEINRLYRIIARCEHQLQQLRPPPETKPPEPTAGEKMLDRYPMLASTSGRVMLGTVVMLGVVFLIGKRLVRK
ncbi:MAG TPA: hypothetical protein VMB80_15705 [Candidatus Acidoferrum sp.]|nr:hypothetical protein [Candidatus Acidoferrum sp.]